MTDEAIVPVAGLSQVERVVDTFVAPSKTFTDILRSANWVVPFLLMVVMSYAVSFSINKKVGRAQALQNQIQANPKAMERMEDLTPEQKAAQMKISVISAKVVSYIYPGLILGIGAIISLVLWATFNFGLGAETKYGQVLAVWMYAVLPKLLASIGLLLILYLGNDQESFNPDYPIGTNLGYYLGDAARWLRTLLSWFDALGLWSLALLVIGMAVIAKKSIAQSAAVVVGWWVLCLLIAVGLAAAF